MSNSVGPDLVPHCLQRLSADDKSYHSGKIVKGANMFNFMCIFVSYHALHLPQIIGHKMPKQPDQPAPLGAV